MSRCEKMENNPKVRECVRYVLERSQRNKGVKKKSRKRKAEAKTERAAKRAKEMEDESRLTGECVYDDARRSKTT